MVFDFTEAHKMLRQYVREFTRREVLPSAKERSKLDRIPEELVATIAKAGFLRAAVPEEHGGEGLDAVSLGIIVEELGRSDKAAAHVALIPTQFSLLLEGGTDEQRQEWLPPTLRGEVMPSFCITEPECGSDVKTIKTRAVRDGDFYVVTGEKTSVTRGMQANLLLVWAKTDPEAGARGVTCFMVPAGSPGISRTPMLDMGMLPFSRASINFDDVRVPARYRIGDEGQGFRLLMERFDAMRVMLCLVALGQAQASMDEAIDYSKQRVAFGRPIAKFEAISFKIAEDLTLIDAGRLLCYRVLWMKDQGMKHTKESAMAKWLIPQWVAKIIWDCILIFGHFGYSQDLPLERRLRDVLADQIGDGTAEIQKLVIVREVLGREFLPY